MNLGLVPNRRVAVRVLAGPFRGARVIMNPRHSLRKIFGVYEHELNRWLTAIFRTVSQVIDVGANDGYFTFGAVAALQHRQVHDGRVIAFEPGPRSVQSLHESMALQRRNGVSVEIVDCAVGKEVQSGVTTLDALGEDWHRRPTLIKIDVEGAEMDVIAGAQSWLQPSNWFLIEIHDPKYLAEVEKIFFDRGLRLDRVFQRPLPLLGREKREAENCWLVSHLPGAA